MNIKEIIAKKRDGLELNKEEIKYFIEEYTKGTVTDYQAAALIINAHYCITWRASCKNVWKRLRLYWWNSR